MTRCLRPDDGVVRATRAAAIAALAGAALVACSGVSPQASCADLHPGSDDRPHDAVVVLLDVADNRPAAADAAATAVRPFLVDALESGRYVELIAYGGEGADVVTSDCLAGDQLLLVDKRNETAQANLMQTGTELLTDEVRDAVLTTPVAPLGSPLRLLSRVNERLATLRNAVEVGETTVVLHSDLLASSDPDDCLNADGVTASSEDATAMVDRCFDEGQLVPLDGAELQLLGVGQRAESTSQTLLAAHLRRELCERLAGGCLGGDPAAVTPDAQVEAETGTEPDADAEIGDGDEDDADAEARRDTDADADTDADTDRAPTDDE